MDFFFTLSHSLPLLLGFRSFRTTRNRPAPDGIDGLWKKKYYICMCVTMRNVRVKGKLRAMSAQERDGKISCALCDEYMWKYNNGVEILFNCTNTTLMWSAQISLSLSPPPTSQYSYFYFLFDNERLENVFHCVRECEHFIVVVNIYFFLQPARQRDEINIFQSSLGFCAESMRKSWFRLLIRLSVYE